MQAQAAGSTSGVTGMVNMPDGRTEADGTWRTGISRVHPYTALFTNITLLDGFEANGRFTRIANTASGFQSDYWRGYGNYKDKAFDFKLRLLRESEYLPSIAIGAMDAIGDARQFPAEYIAASKKFGPVDATIGYGRKRIDGVFGGVRVTHPALPDWSLVAEYDAHKYEKDLLARQSGANKRTRPLAAAIEYRWGWINTQLNYNNGAFGGMLSVSVPLNWKEFVPKFEEPAPFSGLVKPAEQLAEWRQLSGENPPVPIAVPLAGGKPAPEGPVESTPNQLVRDLLEHDFRNVELGSEGGTLHASLTNSRISSQTRAIGRAARVLAAHAPADIRAVKVTYHVAELPTASYTFSDLPLLRQYFAGEVDLERVRPSIVIEHAGTVPAADAAEILTTVEGTPNRTRLDNHEGDFIALRHESSLLNRVKVAPKLSLYLNDPSGAFRYDAFLQASFAHRFAPRTWLLADADLTLKTDVNKVAQRSNSPLEHVRSDIADYKKDGGFRISRLLLNQYYHLAPRTYARLSGGLYETMFGGVGGQALHFFDTVPLAVDIAVDAVRQRDPDGLRFRDYGTVTAIASAHVRLTPELTATVRAGRFLARDLGGRLEVTRRFGSGVEMGAWYSVTNAQDYKLSAGSNYRDKGIFMRLPLGPLLTRDTQAATFMSIAPWTRDMAQMVVSPGDLYGMLKKPVTQDMLEDGGLGDLGK